MRTLSVEEVHARMVGRLGLDPSAADLSFPEALACAVRRAAGLVCPIPPRSLVRAVLRPFRGLVENDGLKERVENMVETLLAHGDLLELERSEMGGDEVVVQIYAAPPSFVRRGSGAVILLGVAPDDVFPLSDELQELVEHANHIRSLPGNAATALPEYLRQSGLVELSLDAWLKAPPQSLPEQYLAELDRRLGSASPSGEVLGLLILDPARPVRYYRGRWVEPKDHTGKFVGRRTQAFGADLWCYVELAEGRPVRLLDLPLGRSKERGCDQAWRIQAAIDSVRGDPQRYRIRLGRDDRSVFDLFSPVPMWARRRWDCFGEPVVSTGCLFAHAFSANEVDEERRFAAERLWLSQL